MQRGRGSFQAHEGKARDRGRGEGPGTGAGEGGQGMRPKAGGTGKRTRDTKGRRRTSKVLGNEDARHVLPIIAIFNRYSLRTNNEYVRVYPRNHHYRSQITANYQFPAAEAQHVSCHHRDSYITTIPSNIPYYNNHLTDYLRKKNAKNSRLKKVEAAFGLS